MSNEGGPKGDRLWEMFYHPESEATGNEDESKGDSEDSNAGMTPNKMNLMAKTAKRPEVMSLTTEELMIVQGERIACYWCDRRHVIAYALQCSR
jgi:hypothetical protein